MGTEGLQGKHDTRKFVTSVSVSLSPRHPILKINCVIVVTLLYTDFRYAYYPVNISRAVGPRIVDRVISNLSNDSEVGDVSTAICAHQQLFIFCGSRDIELSRDTYVRYHWSIVYSGDKHCYQKFIFGIIRVTYCKFMILLWYFG